MNAAYRHLIIFNGYPFSAVLAVLFHGLVLGFVLYWNGRSESSEFELVQPTVIKALFIDENPQLRERQRLERQQVERRREQARAEEERARLIEEERLRRLELDEERRRQLEQERLQREEEERLRQEEERSLAEAERREREQLQLQVEEERALAEQERLREQEAAERRRLEEAAAAAAARTEFEVVQSGAALIQQFVEKSWNRPPSARNGMRAVLRIDMLPTGEVTDVAILQSSGDAPFDRAARNAVYSAQPFSELQEMPIHIFNDNFRTYTLTFQPEDLLN